MTMPDPQWVEAERKLFEAWFADAECFDKSKITDLEKYWFAVDHLGRYERANVYQRFLGWLAARQQPVEVTEAMVEAGIVWMGRQEDDDLTMTEIVAGILHAAVSAKRE